jgi:short-subunit dehydrogenase
VLWARDADELARAVAVLRDEGYAARAMVCDVREHEAVEDIVTTIESEIGPIQVAVHVAGIIQVGPLQSLTREHFQQAIDTMTWGPVNVALAVLPAMRRRGSGHIGIITSIGGLVSVPHLLPYSTAKFGAVGFSNGLRAELAGTGVTVTTVAPGLMRTGSHLRAEFTGDAPAEYAWFAPGASLPLVSMDAERAAARIVRGILRGRSIVLLTPLAKVGARVAGVAPATTAAAMSLMAQLLPGAPAGPTGTVEGRVARRVLASPLVERLTVWGTRAAARNNENGG